MTDSNPQEIKDMRLDAIVDYEMDELEAKAYKLCLIWLDRSRKIFPDYQHTKLKRGDPRKSLVFKMCYKLVRETNGVIPDEEYPLYIRAQLDVLRHIVVNSKAHVLIDPGCLVGDKAWVRWKLWKKKYDTVSQKPQEVSQVTHPGIAKALDGLEKTKEFITKTFGANPSIDKYQESKTNNNFYRWVNLGKISPYYIAISPFVAKIFTADDLAKLNFDLSVYRPCITDIVHLKFKELFPNE
jgi:hypothetical protein